LKTRILIALVLIAAIGAGYYYWSQENASAPVAETPALPTAQEEPAPVEPAPPAWDAPKPVQHPIETPPTSEPLPAVKDSDQLITPPLKALFGTDLWRELFYPEEIIRRIVTTVDNLPRNEASSKLWPLQPAGTWMETVGEGETMIISPINAERYARYMLVVQNISIDKLVGVYRQFYPLFQRAYADLGYPDAYFNDRLVTTIDDLLATPEPIEAPKLVQKKVVYQFADPDLERRSAGQKIMLRIGVENAQIVKMRLRELRAAITKQAPVPATK